MFFMLTGLFLAFASYQYIDIGDVSDLPKKETYEVIAHRGVHQDFHKEDLDIHTCTANRIYKPTHHFIENTLESMQAAFDYGATMVELDIRVTKDKKLVVFHDYMLGCRTQAEGNVSDFLLKDLKKLDLGYGYTYDGGETYPFRGKAVGKIKTLKEVLTYFPNKKFLIDNKNWNDMETAKLIVGVLGKFPQEQQKNFFLWTGDKSFAYIQERLPLVSRLLLPKPQQKAFFKSYILSLGLSKIDSSYKHEGLGLPVEYTKYIWGWPNDFLKKVYDNDTRFYVYVNTKEEYNKIKDIPLDGIITDHIEKIGSLAE